MASICDGGIDCAASVGVHALDANEKSASRMAELRGRATPCMRGALSSLVRGSDVCQRKYTGEARMLDDMLVSHNLSKKWVSREMCP